MKTSEETKRRRQIAYLFHKIQDALINYRCSFLTLTFSDTTLERTSEETRERYIKNYLKRETAFYIVNKDYGSEKKREHYHAFIIPTTLRNEDIENRHLRAIKYHIDFKAYKYGQIQAEYIGTKYQFKGERNYEMTAQYLAEHFYKYTAKNNRVIYSREIQPKEEQIKRLERLYKRENEPIKASKPIKKHMTEEEIINDALGDYFEFEKAYKSSDEILKDFAYKKWRQNKGVF